MPDRIEERSNLVMRSAGHCFVTVSREAQAAIEVMKQGAYDCLFKPPESSYIARVAAEALEIARRLREPRLTAEVAADRGTNGQLIGACPAMRHVYKAIGLVAAQNFPVIITGESGTGKELVGRAIHQHSNRAGQPFLALNAAAIPEALLESELLGRVANGKTLRKHTINFRKDRLCPLRPMHDTQAPGQRGPAGLFVGMRDEG